MNFQNYAIYWTKIGVFRTLSTSARKTAYILSMEKVELKPKKNGRVGQFLRKFAEIVNAGGPFYIQPLCMGRLFGNLE